MASDTDGASGRRPPWTAGPDVPALAVPEIRDYQRVNAELALRLDEGHRVVRLAGVEGQRLLTSGLRGDWRAVVLVEGRAGPELAAGMDAPGLLVVCLGGAADGAGAGLHNGRVAIRGAVGAGLGYAQRGGALIVGGDAEARAGLNQSGGSLILLGRAGMLAGERQSGGLIYAHPARLGPHAGRGRRGGRFVALPVDRNDAEAAGRLREALSDLDEWVPGLAMMMGEGP